jgi:capsule polysaccharide modification protein KpsS
MGGYYWFSEYSGIMNLLCRWPTVLKILQQVLQPEGDGQQSFILQAKQTICYWQRLFFIRSAFDRRLPLLPSNK